MNAPSSRPVLHAIVCAAGPASRTDRFIDAAQRRGWDVHLIPTPSATAFIDVGALERQTGHPVLTTYGSARVDRSGRLPRGAAIVVAPATFNTINKWAAGASDNYALGLLAESFGMKIPTVVLPFVNEALAAHFAFQRSVAALREAGARVLLGPGIWEPHPPRAGAHHIAAFPWTTALDAAQRAVEAG